MKKIVLSLALAVFLFAGVGLAGGAGVASAHEGQGTPPFDVDWIPEDFDPTDPDTWPHVHAPGHANNTDVAFARGGPAHFGHQHNPNCGNMHAGYHAGGGPPHPGNSGK